jgi:hypothetical protein
VHLQGADFMAVYRGEQDLEGLAHLPPLVARMLDELSWWTHALAAARTPKAAAGA